MPLGRKMPREKRLRRVSEIAAPALPRGDAKKVCKSGKFCLNFCAILKKGQVALSTCQAARVFV